MVSCFCALHLWPSPHSRRPITFHDVPRSPGSPRLPRPLRPQSQILQWDFEDTDAEEAGETGTLKFEAEGNSSESNHEDNGFIKKQ